MLTAQGPPGPYIQAVLQMILGVRVGLGYSSWFSMVPRPKIRIVEGPHAFGVCRCGTKPFGPDQNNKRKEMHAIG